MRNHNIRKGRRQIRFLNEIGFLFVSVLEAVKPVAANHGSGGV